MTIYGQTDGLVVGQPINPNFGAANGAQAPTAGLISQPTQAPVTGGMQATGVQMPLLEAVSRGLIPRNVMVNSVAGVSTGGLNPTPIDDLMSNGAGNQINAGVAVAGVAGNPVLNGAIDQQQFVDGTGAVAQSANGPTPTGTESLTSGPVSGATTTANVTLGSTFQG